MTVGAGPPQGVATVARLRAGRGADAIGLTIGGSATTAVDGTFPVGCLVLNTIANLTTQAALVACFRNVAAHFEPGRWFVVEVRVPDLRRLPPGQDAVPLRVGRHGGRSGATTSPPRQ